MIGAVSAASVHADDATPVLEEILVTAQKRSQNLQDVPAAISAIDGEALTDQGGAGFATLANRVPGLQLTQLGATNTQLSMRGVSQGLDRADRPQIDNTVGLYFDDVSIGVTSANPNYQLFDLERVEVLRGPQGTLFGAGAMSGAIRLITRKPTLDAFESSAGLTASTTDGGKGSYLANGTVNVPLVEDALAVRALGYYRYDGGFIDNLNVGRSNTTNNTTTGGRLAVKWLPTDDLSVTAMAALQDIETDDFEYYAFDAGFSNKTEDAREPVEDRSRLYTLTLEYSLGATELTSVSSYQTKYQLRWPETGGFPMFFGGAPGQFGAVHLPTVNDVSGFSQELRLGSSGDQLFDWLVGVFYSDSSRLMTQLLDVPGFDVALGPPASNFGLPPDRMYSGRFEVDTRQSSAFTDVSYRFADAWELAGGLRWFRYEQEADVDYRGALQGAVDTVSRSGSDSGVNPKLALTYFAAPDKQVYAQVAKGFRLGGPNEPISADLCANDLAQLGLSGVPATFGPDELWNYELGAKTRWADRRASLNVALFYVDWNDFQVQRSLACGNTVIQNAGKLVSQGVELDAAWQVSSDLLLSANLTYTDSALAKTDPTLGRKGDPAPYIPELSWSAALDYRKPLTNAWTMFGSVDVQHVGERQSAFSLSRAQILPAYTLGNLRLGASSGPWEAALFVNNVSNERAVLNKNFYAFSTIPTVQTFVVRPRTVGVSLQKKF